MSEYTKKKNFEGSLSDKYDKRALPIERIYYVSHASRHAHRDLFERHRTSDLNRITCAPIITWRSGIYYLCMSRGASGYKRLLGFILCNCARRHSSIPERDLHRNQISKANTENIKYLILILIQKFNIKFMNISIFLNLLTYY